MIAKKIIQVCGSQREHRLIWDALALLLPVSFHFVADLAQAASADALIVLGDARPDLLVTAAKLTTRCLIQPTRTSENARKAESVTFGSQGIDRRLRGRTLRHSPIAIESLSGSSAHATILAHSGNDPLWTRQAHGSLVLEEVTVPLPLLAEDALPFEHLNGNNFISLVPLVHFLRETLGDQGWRPPSLRACLMFDDPNLHASSYGFVHFAEVLRLAKKTPFHATFAMVPFDAWFADSQTVDLFRNNPEHLSLLFHGNNHLRAELGRSASGDDQLRMLAQARRRISSFEKRTNLTVSKVMAPPHGACSAETAQALLALGYHGAFISAWSMRDWGLHQSASAVFGLDMAECVSAGLPIAPRFRLSDDCEAAIVVAAFLDQPIVPVGHHDSLREGADLLARVADKINSLGTVDWLSPQAILETNYATFQAGNCLRVRPSSASMTLEIPAGIDSLVIESPASVRSPFQYVIDSDSSNEHETISRGQKIQLHGRKQVRISPLEFNAVRYENVETPAFSAWAASRRILCEVRDRLQPLAKGRAPSDRPANVQPAAPLESPRLS